MALILKKAWNGYIYVFEDIVDPRTKPLPLVAKPYQVIVVLALYVMFVLKWGPKWMKNRQPYNLNKLLIAYNAFQIVACTYMLTYSIIEAWGWKYKWICEPIDYSDSPSGKKISRLVYCYFLLKVLDLLDTIFFVLRKKYNQVTFLHIYHHTGMVLLIWGAVTYLPGGHGTLIGVINSFVHIVMYSYYLLTVAVPSVRNAFWIKKHVTQLQIVQFFWCVVHMTIIVFKTDCEYPRWTAALFLPQNLFMLVLFLDFYIKTYMKKPKQKVSVKNSIELNNLTHNNGIEQIKSTDIIMNKLSNGRHKLNNNNIRDYNKNGYEDNVNIRERMKDKLYSANGKIRTNSHGK